MDSFNNSNNNNQQNNKPINLSLHSMLKSLKEATKQVGLDVDDSSLEQGLREAMERHKIYNVVDTFREKELLEKHGIDPKQCFNEPCEHNEMGCCDCVPGKPVGCIYRMVDPPPNSLNYDEYMPSHQEALDRLQKHGLLKGDSEDYYKDSSDYGKPETQEERKMVEVKGLTIADIEQCYINACFLSSGLLKKDYPKSIYDLPWDNMDPIAIKQNLVCEIERKMGIFPNIKVMSRCRSSKK